MTCVSIEDHLAQSRQIPCGLTKEKKKKSDKKDMSTTIMNFFSSFNWDLDKAELKMIKTGERRFVIALRYKEISS